MGLLLASFCGLILCSRVAGASQRLTNSEVLAAAQRNPEAEFRAWVNKHSKPYATDEAEYQRRFSIWKKSLKYIQEYNQKHDTHWLGLNINADLTNEEFASSRLGLDVELAKNHPRQEMELSVTDVPDAVDWREKNAVTKVKNQEQCGACWAFSTTGAIEGINAIYSGSLVSLSEQELVDCDVGIDHGCRGGLMDHAFHWVIKNGGIDTEEDYKYHAQQGVCNVARENRHVVTIDAYNDVPSNRSLQLQAAVAEQPVAIAIQANQIDFQLYAGGVLTAECGTSLDHGVLIVGYGTENSTAYWLVKNSWGPEWGESGYVKIERDLEDGTPGKCGIAMLPSYPVKTSPTPPKPPPPAPKPPPTPTPPTPPPAPYVQCDDYVACVAGTTCCCMFDLGPNECLQWRCCPYPEASCCDDHIHCCPHNYPVCDIEHLRCRTGQVAGGAGMRGSGAMATIEPDFLSVALGENVPAIPNPVNHPQDTLVQEVI